MKSWRDAPIDIKVLLEPTSPPCVIKRYNPVSRISRVRQLMNVEIDTDF